MVSLVVALLMEAVFQAVDLRAVLTEVGNEADKMDLAVVKAEDQPVLVECPKIPRPLRWIFFRAKITPGYRSSANC